MSVWYMSWRSVVIIQWFVYELCWDEQTYVQYVYVTSKVNDWYVLCLQEWLDKRLAWENQQKFENLSEFVVDSVKIWTPELALINAWVLIWNRIIYLMSHNMLIC